MSSDPLVTIVVPCYKLGHLLSQCVHSILKQDYENFEVLIMDNCSPDNTPEVAQSFNDPRVRHIRNESNLGHIRNFNKGIALARGKYVWMILVDDTLRSPHVLGGFIDVMERNPRVGFVFCRAVELHGGEEKGICRWADCGDENQIWKGETFFHRLIEANCIVAASMLVRKECYPPGPYQIHLPWASDWYVACLIAMHFDVAYLSEPMVGVRIHEESLTTQYSQDYARLCIGDELGVLWHVGLQAELAGSHSLRSACEAAFVRRAVRLLAAGLQGVVPSMTAADFEMILQARIEDLEQAKRLQSSVYNALTEKVNALPHQGHPSISGPNELGALLGLRRHAELAGIASLRDACATAFVRRAAHLLRAGLQGVAPSLSTAEFETLFQTPTGSRPDAKQIQASVYTVLGDKQYSAGEYNPARKSYRLGLTAWPWQMKTWAKYLLLRTGHAGVRLRQLSQ